LQTPSIMHLERLTCTQFKNYSTLDHTFSSSLNVIVGKNGTGKTNLLDAIHYLCLTKSALHSTDNQNIQHGKEGFVLQGTFYKDNTTHQVICRLKRNERKVIKHNDTPYEKLSTHIGQFPLVLMSPYDTDLVRGSSTGRRRFFDNLLCQLDATYLQKMIQYNQFLRQRSALLKPYLYPQIFYTEFCYLNLSCFSNNPLKIIGIFLIILPSLFS